MADSVPAIAPLIRAAQLLGTVQLQLEHAGYPPGLVEHAIDRARGTAQYKVRAIRASIQADAFYDILVAELAGAEPWMIRQQQFARGELLETE